MKVEINGLSLCYSDVDALVEATIWDIMDGEIHLLIGPNGSGKTSFLKCLSGTVESYAQMSGSILIDEKPVSSWNIALAHEAGILFVPQEPTLVDDLTALENIVLGNETFIGFFKWDRERDRKLVISIMQESGLVVPLDIEVGKLPASSKQKTSILQTLYKLKLKRNVQFILLDEPTTHLTRDEVDSFLVYLQSCKKQFNIGVIVISHELNPIISIVDKVTIFDRGSVVSTYSIDEYNDNFKDAVQPKVLSLQLNPSRFSNSNLLDCDATVVVEASTLRMKFCLSSGSLAVIAGTEDLLNDLFSFIVGMPLFYKWEGTLTLHDKSISKSSISARRKLGMGLISSDKTAYGIFGELSVYQNIATRYKSNYDFIYSLRCLQSSTKTLMDVNIDQKKWHRSANSLSGGNKQRLIFGREYVQSPSVLILRHPTQGLDEESRNEMSKYLSLLLDSGSAIVLLGGSDLHLHGGRVINFH